MIKHRADDHGVGLRTVVIRWADLTLNDPFDCLHLKGAKALSFQVIGEFDGAVARMIGSNDGKSWDVLTGSLGLAIEMRHNGLAPIDTRSQFVSPSIKGGGPRTKLTFLVLMEMPQ